MSSKIVEALILSVRFMRGEVDISERRIREVEAALAEARAAPAAEPKPTMDDVRKRFHDPAFIRWLEEGISDCGHTVFDTIGDVADAWAAWSAKDYYAAPAAEPVATDRERGIWRAAITLANNICVQECDRINDDDGPMPAIDATNQCAKRIRAWIYPADDQFAAMLTEAGVPAAPPPVAKAAEPVGWALIYSNGTTEAYMGKDCPSLNATPGIRARPLVWGDTAPPPVEASQQQRCPCGDRPATECPGEWEPGCDLGANETFARRVDEASQQQAIGEDADLAVLRDVREVLKRECEALKAELSAAKAEALEWAGIAGSIAKQRDDANAEAEAMREVVRCLRAILPDERWADDAKRMADAAIAAQRGEKE